MSIFAYLIADWPWKSAGEWSFIIKFAGTAEKKSIIFLHKISFKYDD